MIDAAQLLADLQRLLKKLENDLRERCQDKDNPAIDAHIRSEYNTAKSAERTSQAYEVWREEFITQVAVSWTLACVFVRFIEDNKMVDEARQPRVWLSGLRERLQLARDQQTLYFREHPSETDREYLEHVFREVAKYPGVSDLFDEQHTPLWSLGLSGDGATELLNFWQQVDPTTGELRHDFTDSEWNTRFLGDLYQDLSETARKKHALLQTPIFVEEFILDRTLTPAINEFGYKTVRLIDPTCGSGHFLLGAFERLFDLRVRNEPAINSRELAQRALSSVYGVDLNPFAVAIARFRLLIAALKVSEIARLQDAPALEINLAVGDSLLHGPPRGGGAADQMNMMWSPMAHVYEAEDKEQLDRILVPGRYHAVVGNPPYITVKDAALNKAYRERFGSCHRQYSLAVPFMERFFDLAIKGSNGDSAGYVGMITSNSFMKREFGKKLIEQYIPRWNLTHVVDTSGAYIPGHSTPTVIMFGRNQKPVADKVRTVMGIKGEPSTPVDPSHGKVWTSIVKGIDALNVQDEFVTIADTARESFHKHPWSIGGGGAADLKVFLDEQGKVRLSYLIDEIGFGAVTREDEAYLITSAVALRKNIPVEHIRPLVSGEEVRDWSIINPTEGIWPYDPTTLRVRSSLPIIRFLWPYRCQLSKRVAYGLSQLERGLQWYEYSMFFAGRYLAPLKITFASVATHNHFVLVGDEKVFKQSAPIITLQDGSTKDHYLAVLGLLNSSVACFWMKQVFYPKGTATGDISTEKGRPEANRFDFAATGLYPFPVPADLKEMQCLIEITRALEHLAGESLNGEPTNLLNKWNSNPTNESLKTLTVEGARHHTKIRNRMVALQEELDWEVYRLFNLVVNGADTTVLEEFVIDIEPAYRPSFWPDKQPPDGIQHNLKQTYADRREQINSSAELALLESPVNKRLWLGQQGVFGHASSTFEERVQDACREWLLNRLEDPRYWPREELTTTARLADRVRTDTEFMLVGEMYRRRSDFDVANLVGELVKSEAVPFLPILRYKPSGLRHRAVWERVWELQRKEDEIDARVVRRQSAVVGTQIQTTPDNRSLTREEAMQLKDAEVGNIPVPPKYKSADFLEQSFWRLRGKLDMPKERFVSYPYCECDVDPSLVIAWAGWDHVQQARALASYYQTVKANEGWGPTRLVPLLGGILELLPWLMQWHNELDPAYGIGMGDFFRGFVEEEAKALGLTLDRIRQWSPID